MKMCRECKQEKPLSEFYKHSAMADGHLNKCIECVKARVSKHREANLEKILAYDRKRGNRPDRVQARKDYAKTQSGKLAKKRAMDKYRKIYPMAYAAHVITSNAIRDGKLVRPTNCSECNSTHKIEGHHDDYTQPLNVRWLCEDCHRKWHRYNDPIHK